MKFFLDGINLESLRKYTDMGIVVGATTNPTFLSEANNYKDTLKVMCSINSGPVSAQVVSDNCDEMMREAENFLSIADNIIIKLPSNSEGIKACKKLAGNGVKTNLTLCFSVEQALLAATVGATFVSAFIGRLEDNGGDGFELVSSIRNLYDGYGFETEIIAASIRGKAHIVGAAEAGSDIVTLSSSVLDSLFVHNLTIQGNKKCQEDWYRKYPQESAKV